MMKIFNRNKKYYWKCYKRSKIDRISFKDKNQFVMKSKNYLEEKEEGDRILGDVQVKILKKRYFFKQIFLGSLQYLEQLRQVIGLGSMVKKSIIKFKKRHLFFLKVCYQK